MLVFVNNLALIVAGGVGQRFSNILPKQYAKVCEKSILRRSIEAFASHPEICSVLVVIHKTHLKMYEECVKDLLTLQPLLQPVFGGDTRQASVQNGLQSLKAISPKNVLIHDAARPFVSACLISRVLEALQEHTVVDVQVPIVDAVRHTTDGSIINKEELRNIQTPQGFDYQTLCALHESYNGTNAPDDVALAYKKRIPVGCVRGEAGNLKITYKEDVAAMEASVSSIMIMQRVGIGIDVHKLISRTNSAIPICGILLPCDYVVEAHSDGDVGLHAITEAILGAIAEGNIGTHFPPSDMRWQNVASEFFLFHANQLLKKKKGYIINIDVTIVCEQPKIMPHAVAMRQNIAKILELDIEQVSVKATTTELMGFLGRKEGIMAQAICSIAMPKRQIS